MKDEIPPRLLSNPTVLNALQEECSTCGRLLPEQRNHQNRRLCYSCSLAYRKVWSRLNSATKKVARLERELLEAMNAQSRGPVTRLRVLLNLARDDLAAKSRDFEKDVALARRVNARNGVPTAAPKRHLVEEAPGPDTGSVQPPEATS